MPILRMALGIAGERFGIARVLVTCDADNIASIKTIERNGGVLERIVSDAEGGHKPFCRYWIETVAQHTAAGDVRGEPNEGQRRSARGAAPA